MQNNGWERKYVISKADGSEVDPAAEYLVLRIDSDPEARSAALDFCVRTENKALAQDLGDRVQCYEMLAEVELKVPVKLTGNNKHVHNILRRLAITKGHCPCIQESAYGEDTICPCRTLRETGECHCGLFLRADQPNE